MRLLVLLLFACTSCSAQDFTWGWTNLNPASDMATVRAIIEPVIKAVHLPSGSKVGIKLDATKGMKPLHIDVNRLSTSPFTDTINENHGKSHDALIRADYQISNRSKSSRIWLHASPQP